MRVGVLTNIPSPYQVELFNAIAARGRVDLRVWYCADRDLRRLWKPPNIDHWHRIGAGWSIKTTREQWYFDPRPAMELVRWHPDIAVVSVYPLPTMQVGMWAATIAGVPWIYWGEAVASGGNGLFRRLGRGLALAPLRWAEGFFAVGRKGVENFRSFISADRPVLTVPYFSNLARFAPATEAVSRAGKETTFLFIGSFTYRKGIDVLARAFSELLRARPNDRLVIAGDGQTTELFDAHLSSDAAARVVRRGFIPWERLPEFYREGNFLVMPSRYDGWGLVIPEAMASGLPVIGSVKAGAALDLVRDGETGWRLTSLEPAALANLMLKASTLSAAERIRMSQESFKRAQRYRAEVGARVFERGVRLLINHSRRRARGV